MSIFITALRVLLGGLFVGHGLQKLRGWFGGHGLEGTGRFFESLGMRPGRTHATAAGLAETGGGALLAAGLATPLAGAALTGTMVQAIRSVHAPNGPWVTDGGWEYNAVIVGAVLAIVEAGGGAASLDARLGVQRTGARWALLALAAGAVGPSLLTRVVAPADDAAPAGDANGRATEQRPLHAVPA